MDNQAQDTAAMFAGLKNPVFMIGDVEFRVNKIKGIEGFSLLELIRIALAGESMNSAMNGEGDEQMGANMFKLLFSVDPKMVIKILDALLPYIDVKLPSADRALPMNQVKTLVDDLIEPVDYYEIIVRGIAVNFTKSIVGLMSRLGLNTAVTEAADTHQ